MLHLTLPVLYRNQDIELELKSACRFNTERLESLKNVRRDYVQKYTRAVVAGPKIFSEPRSGEENFLPPRGYGGMLPWKIFKIKGPRLAKNAFPEVSAWKN